MTTKQEEKFECFKNAVNKLKVDSIKDHLEKAFKRAEVKKEISAGTYIGVYEDLIAFTKKNIATLDESTLVGLAHMVYGWMPTVLKSIDASDESLCDELKKIERTNQFDVNIASKLMKVTNNSLVGASKLLHFIKPNIYPIYDSRVFRAIINQDMDETASKNADYYNAYAERLNAIKSSNPTSIKILREYLKKDFKVESAYDYSDVRVLELCLYISGKPESKKVK